MSAGPLLDLPLAAAVVLSALWTLRAPSLSGAVLGFVAAALLLSLVWWRLGAVDVALSAAAIGAGATGAVLLHGVTRRRHGAAERPAAAPGRLLCALAALLALLVGGALAAVVLALPDPPPGLAAPAVAGAAALGLANPVSAVLIGPRALDTLLGSVALVLAVLAVWSMAPDRRWGRRLGPEFRAGAAGKLSLPARVLPPVGIVIGACLVWVGTDAPGGRYPVGALLAAMWLLPWIAGLARPPRASDVRLRLLLVAGPLLFLGAGLAGLVLADGFLAYPPGIARPLILLIEAAMTLSVAAALACLILGPPERADASGPAA